MICINGEMKEGYDEKSLAYMIEQEEFNLSRIATEINGEIIPKKDYETVQIKENDVIEVVSFVGGG